jgi:hypothetical protein
LDTRRLAPRADRSAARGNRFRKELPMLDLLMLALGLGFFILSIGYAYVCERL